MNKTIEFIYRDYGNYKWNLHIKISNDKIQELKKKYGQLKVGIELFYDTDLNITQGEFHKERGYKYDDEIDHNIIEIVKILSDEEAQYEPVTFYVEYNENHHD